jgi:hypothetical protein
MPKTVYYLVHKDTQQRLQYYKTRAGARIAQHRRNAGLGFTQRIERVEQFNNWEVELYRLGDGTIAEGTYCIIEDTIDSNDADLLEDKPDHRSDLLS